MINGALCHHFHSATLSNVVGRQSHPDHDHDDDDDDDDDDDNDMTMIMK